MKDYDLLSGETRSKIGSRAPGVKSRIVNMCVDPDGAMEITIRRHLAIVPVKTLTEVLPTPGTSGIINLII